MRLLARVITILARICDQIAGLLFRAQQLRTGILTVLLPTKELTRLIRTHYDDNYQDMAARHPETYYKWTLESWEEDVILRHKMTSGSILVLGANVGREFIALAQRGFLVMGLDINRESLCVASHQAMTRGLRLLVAQADFQAIPVLPARIDYIFMSGIMYSAIPDRQQRQAWV